MPERIKHARSREALAWLKTEIVEQKARYRKIKPEENPKRPKREFKVVF